MDDGRHWFAGSADWLGDNAVDFRLVRHCVDCDCAQTMVVVNFSRGKVDVNARQVHLYFRDVVCRLLVHREASVLIQLVWRASAVSS